MLVVLKALKTSTSGSRRNRSPNVKVFERRRSSELKLSLNRAFDGASGSCWPFTPPAAFTDCMNELSSLAFLNNRPPAFRCSEGILDEPSGKRMSIGTPDASVRIGENMKPYGNRNVPAAVNRCRWSFGAGPNSSVKFRGSIGPLEKGIWSSFAKLKDLESV